MSKAIECVGGASESDDFQGKCVGASDPVRDDALTRRTYTLEDRLKNPDAFLNRSDLRELGLPRRAIDAIFRVVPVVLLEGYSKPMIQVRHFLGYVEDSTYRGGDRVQ